MPPQWFAAPNAITVRPAVFSTVFQNVHRIPVENITILNREKLVCIFFHDLESGGLPAPARVSVSYFLPKMM